jgi:hypothetical protein
VLYCLVRFRLVPISGLSACGIYYGVLCANKKCNHFIRFDSTKRTLRETVTRDNFIFADLLLADTEIARIKVGP